MSLAILCSGQGNQHPDMFALTAREPAADAVFAAATQALGNRDPRDLVQGGNDLHGNATGQILCVTQALAAFAALKPRLGGRLILAGYSVGEVAAWGCAGVFAADTLLALAARRAAAMDAASGPDDGLAYLRGLPRTAVDALCRERGLAVAIVNPGDMYVIGGARPALAAACEAALANGATHGGALKVHVASHTAKLAGASASFREILRAAPAAARLDGRVRLFSGIDAAAVRDIGQGLDKLARQVSETIDWAGCLQASAEAGMTAALELGPGNALATMTAAAFPQNNARSLDDFRSLDGVARWLESLER